MPPVSSNGVIPGQPTEEQPVDAYESGNSAHAPREFALAELGPIPPPTVAHPSSRSLGDTLLASEPRRDGAEYEASPADAEGKTQLRLPRGEMASRGSLPPLPHPPTRSNHPSDAPSGRPPPYRSDPPPHRSEPPPTQLRPSSAGPPQSPLPPVPIPPVPIPPVPIPPVPVPPVSIPPVPMPPTRLDLPSEALAGRALPPVPEPPTRLHLPNAAEPPNRSEPPAHGKDPSQPSAPPAWKQHIARVATASARIATASRVAVGVTMRRARQGIEQGFQRSVRGVEARRVHFPAPIARAVAGVSSQTLAGAGILLGLALFVGCAWVVLARSLEPAAPPVVVRIAAPSASVAAAPPSGSTASVALQPRGPNWSRAVSLLEQAGVQAGEHNDPQAAKLVARALELSIDLRDDDRVAKVVFQSAQSPSKVATDTAFALLQGPMGARGAELVYRIALDKNTRDAARRRAEKWLRGAAFRRAASGDLTVAVGLRFADTCEAKRGLLDRAAREGADLTLEPLRELNVTRGCGVSGEDDCYPCLRQDSRLEHAIKQVEGRVRG